MGLYFNDPRILNPTKLLKFESCLQIPPGFSKTSLNTFLLAIGHTMVHVKCYSGCLTLFLKNLFRPFVLSFVLFWAGGA